MVGFAFVIFIIYGQQALALPAVERGSAPGHGCLAPRRNPVRLLRKCRPRQGGRPADDASAQAYGGLTPWAPAPSRGFPAGFNH
jgi:hypothetical protein